MPPRPPDPDFYRVLGVKPSTSAAEIKKAYRRLAVKHHPDKQRPNKAEAATKKLARINEAYTVLGDADQRRMHDLQRSDAAGPPAGLSRAPAWRCHSLLPWPGWAVRLRVWAAPRTPQEGLRRSQNPVTVM